MVFIELQSLCCDFVGGGGGGGHVYSALDLGGGSHEFYAGLAPIFWPPQHFSNEHSLSICILTHVFLSLYIVQIISRKIRMAF